MKKILTTIFLFLLFNSIGKSQIVINEISANNVSKIQGPSGDFDDWIELYNAGNSSVDLTGYHLSDNAAFPYKFTIQNGSIAAGGFKLIFANGENFDTQIDHWEQAVDKTDSWRYFVANSQPDTNWRKLSFNDQAWLVSPGGLGYGDSDDHLPSIAHTNSVLLRRKFVINDPAEILTAVLSIDYDDGFVAYLNGVEFARSNVGSPKRVPAYDQNAATDHEAAMYSGGDPEYYSIDFKLLRNTLIQGNNLLAVQVHNSSISSNDLSSNVFLEFGVKSSTVVSPVHSWFDGTVFQAYQAPFKLDRQGEEIFLYDSIGNLIDQKTYTDMQPDYSGGRKPNGGAWCAFNTPTPGTSNSGSTCYTGVCPVPVFSAPAGFYTSTFTLHATTTLSGATIRYTTDGSDPKSSSSTFPGGGISISSTKTIKAMVFKSGYLPSPIVNNTYFKNQSAHLPSFCINTDPDNLFDSLTGIYELGPNADSVSPHFGANYWQDWQKPAMLEYFDRGHVQKFQVNADISIYGNYSRSKPQKSFEVRVDKNRGTGAIDYPLFPDKPFLPSIDNFILRNAGTDWNKVHFRDACLERLMKNTYSGYLAAEPVNVFINGDYWGVYCTYENHDQHWMNNNYGYNRREVDYLLDGGSTKMKLGSSYDFERLVNYAESANPTSSSYYQTIDSLLDLKNFTDYFIAETYFNNEDWIGQWTNNIKIWRPEGGKWKYLLYDLDYTTGYVGGSSTNTLQAARNPQSDNNTSDLFDAVLDNPTYKNYFINRYADLINTTFQSDSVEAIKDSFKDSMQYDMPQHFAKWGGSVSTWNSYVNSMKSWLNSRVSSMRNIIKNEFNMTSQVSLTLKVSPAGAGRIQISTITPGPLPWTGVYFNGNPVTITAIPNPGYSFDHWLSNNVIAASDPNQSITRNFTSTDAITAYFTGTALSPSVVISEINYNSDSAFNTHDWIELHNPANYDLDISQWSLKDSNDYHYYTFPVNTVIPANGYIVVVEDIGSFSSLHPSVSNFTGPMGFNLGNGGDQLRLFDNNGATVINMSFDDKAPWPVTPDGDGYTLEILNTGGSPSSAANWFAGCYGGSPGRAYSLPVAQVSPPSNFFICADSTMQLNALSNPLYSYQWQNHHVDIPGATSDNLIIDTAGVYSLVVNSQGCSVVSSNLTINEIPHTSVPIVHDSSLCDSGQLTLVAIDTAVVHWYDNASSGLPIATGQNFITPILNASATFYTDAGSVCPSARVPVNVVVHPSPVVNLGNDTLLPAGTAILIDAGSGFSSYQWSDGSTMQTLTAVCPASVSVIVTDAFNCSGTDVMQISILNGINYLSNSSGISFYPNPVHDKLSFSINKDQNQTISIQLIDPEGRILEERIIKHKGINTGEFEMSNYSKGIYIVSVSSEIDRKQFKVVVE